RKPCLAPSWLRFDLGHSDLKPTTLGVAIARPLSGRISLLVMMMTGGEPMPAERVSMRRVREILRLKYECGATERAIAQSLGIARSTVAVTLDRLAAAELGWPLPASLSDKVLEAMLYAGPGTQRGSRRKAEPDWTH